MNINLAIDSSKHTTRANDNSTMTGSKKERENKNSIANAQLIYICENN